MKHFNCLAAYVYLLATFAAVGSYAQEPGIEIALRNTGARVEVYKTTMDAKGKPVKLNTYIFFPEDHKPSDQRPAIIFFFGGGWSSGQPSQFTEHCKYLASRGMVAMTVDYRVSSRQQTKAKHCVSDGKSAVRWVRENAKRLGIDANRVVVSGGSAGGHVAACTGLIKTLDEPDENSEISSAPNAMVLFNPVVALCPIDGKPGNEFAKQAVLKERLGADPKSISPFDHVAHGVPPTLIFHGKADSTVPYWTVEAFAEAMQNEGNQCQLIGFEGESHGFFNYGRGKNTNYEKTIVDLDNFLVSLGYLDAAAPGEKGGGPFSGR